MNYTADVGEKNAAWLTDSDNFDGHTVAHDNGNGRVTITQQQLDWLIEHGDEGGDGFVGDDPVLFIRLPHVDPDNIRAAGDFPLKTKLSHPRNRSRA